MLNYAVIFNSCAIIIGTLIGKWLGSFFNSKIRNILFDSIGLTTIIIGISMGLKSNNMIIVLISLAIGGVIGEFLNIEKQIESLTSFFKNNKETVSKGFLTTTILFVVGPMTILGSMKAGLSQDNTLLNLKSILDGISSIIFASIYGYSVILSAISVFFVETILIIFSKNLYFLMDEVYLNDFTAVGGIMILGLGIRLLDLKDIKVGNFLPALLMVIIIDYIKLRFSF